MNPKKSIITPSYNQSSFIESTIQSVINQNYSILEYIVIDGGSTDDTVLILEKYNNFITHWVSEPDKGQADALNKGLLLATGEIIGWLNSDDTYQPEILAEVVKAFQDPDVNIVMSEYFGFMDKDGHIYNHNRNEYKNYESLVRYWNTNGITINQPCVFFRRKLLGLFNPVMDASLEYAMDYDLWLRIARHYPIKTVSGHWANYRVHDASKSGRGFQVFFNEWDKVSRRYWGDKYSIRWWQNLCSYFYYKLSRLIKDYEPGDSRLNAQIFSEYGPIVDRLSSSSINVRLPLVTLVVTNYNYEKFLEECLTSITRQDYQNIECIIVDDKSTDGSVALIKRYLHEHKLEEKFRLIEHSQNIGQLGAFITGGKNANGSFIVFVDADDILLENFVSAHVHIHLQNFPVAFTCSLAYGISENRELRGYVRLGNFRKVPVKVLSQAFYTLQWPWSCTSSMMFRKAVLQYLPEPDLASYRYCADLYLCYVANLLGGSILIPEAYTAYRLHDSNQFQTNPIIGDNSGIGDMKKHPVHADMQDSVRKGFIDSYHKLSTLYGISGYLKLVARTTPFKKLFPTCKILHDARILSSRQICFFAFRCMYYNIKYWYLLLFKPVKLPQMLDL